MPRLVELSLGQLSNKEYMAHYVAEMRHGNADVYALMKLLRMTTRPTASMMKLGEVIVDALNDSVERIVVEYLRDVGDQPAVFSFMGVPPYRGTKPTTVSNFPSLFRAWSTHLRGNLDPIGIFVNGGLSLITTHCVICGQVGGHFIGSSPQLKITGGGVFYNRSSVPQLLFEGPVHHEHPEGTHAIENNEYIRSVCMGCRAACRACGWALPTRYDKEAVRTMAVSQVCPVCAREFLIHVTPPKTRLQDQRRARIALSRMGG